MAIVAGTRLGPYEIVAPIGAGGMGEVYRGRDTRLDRTVAVKVLPESVARDPTRLARFEREAKTLAALNHTNVAQIYGVEGIGSPAAGDRGSPICALVMEFVEGEDLSARIAQGPIAVDEALAIAAQIAAALEAAHESGIIHRDLKPSNIRVREDGTVKVLDFGLAKALAAPASVLESTPSPTITIPALTREGAILGTAAYMSPEQARAMTVDKRADIWAFGVVLYEMTTGRRPFEGETFSESLAEVLKSEPNWSPVPAGLRRLLRSCLEKDPRKRLRDIGDWRRQLEDSAEGGAATVAKRPWLLWGMTAAFAIAAASLALIHFLERTPVSEVVSFQIPPPAHNTFETNLAVSPDGRRVAFTAKGADNRLRVWVRDFASIDSRPLAGTDEARSVSWSPDGRSVAFVADRTLKRTTIDGGPVLTIYQADTASEISGGSWNGQGVIVFGGIRAGAIRRVSESGGPVSPVTILDKSRGDVVHGIPMFLPDGRHFLYTRVGVDAASSGVYVGSIDRKPEEQETTRLLAASHAVYAPSDRGHGHVLYLRQGTLVAHGFDAEQRTLLGEPVPVAEGVGNSGALGFFSAGAGVVAFRGGARAAGVREAQLTWLDRQGNRSGTIGRPAAYDGVSLSPDGARAAVILAEFADVGLGNVDLWIVELARGVSQRLTSHPATEREPTWSPAGDRIAFFSSRSGTSDLYTMSSNGTGPEELLLRSEVSKSPTSWSRDGRFLLFESAAPAGDRDIWVLPLQGERKPVPLVQTTFSEFGARFSPDMQWIAYTSQTSGQAEIYIRPFNAAAPGSASGAGTLVSREGGTHARWRTGGREVIFQGADGSIMAVDFTTDGGQLQPGAPKTLFTLPAGSYWDVTADGARFLVTMPTVGAGLVPITVLLNWDARIAK